jgi:4-diphosphocytidyl-2-C-methyl-D-erythritol kinase
MSSQPPSVLREKAPAKLNLHLHVTGRRADGYHELDTSFVMIDWYDEVRVSRRSDGEVRRVADHADISLEADLSVRAARLLREQCLQLGVRCPGVDLLVHKSIPLGAGLGGGSSNAASTLRLLNRLWELHWPYERLAELGARLGADVPVFVHRRHALARGIGEILKPLPLSRAHFVLVFPNVKVATGGVFDAPELTRSSEALKIQGCVSWESLLRSQNDLEKVASKRFREVQGALLMLREEAASAGLPPHWPRMSGSGSTVFTMVRSASEGAELKGHLQALCRRDGRSGWTVRDVASLP